MENCVILLCMGNKTDEGSESNVYVRSNIYPESTRRTENAPLTQT